MFVNYALLLYVPARHLRAFRAKKHAKVRKIFDMTKFF